MTSSSTSAIYVNVIEDVVNKIRDEFVDNGRSVDGVLAELQGLWELKMMQSGAILGPIDRSSVARPPVVGGAIAPVHDLNVPYLGTEEYETPTADILFPPTPMQTPFQTPLPGSVQTPLPGSVQTPLPGTVENSPYNIATGSSDYSDVNDNGGTPEMKFGRPGTYMQSPSPWMNQRTPLGVDVNVAYVEGREDADRGTSNQTLTQDLFRMPGGKRKRDDFDTHHHNGGYIPQQDGAEDSTLEFFQGSQGSSSGGKGDTNNFIQIPQLDEPIPDPYEDVLSAPNNMYNYQGVVNEDYNIVNTPAPNDMPTPAAGLQYDDGDDDDDEPPLNENDDDDLDDVEQEEDLNTQHLVLAQFDKVTRTKSRWKCTLKDGIMHINGRDVLFNKASGEFEF